MLARNAAAVALALALVPGMALGQGAAPAPRSLPALSFDAMVGVTYGPSRIGGASYNTTTSAGRLALALRLGSRGRVRPVLVVDYSGMPELPRTSDDISLFPNGGSAKRSFPKYSGFGAGLGLRLLVGSGVTVGATGGAARYQDRFTAGNSRRTAFFIDADVAALMVPHIGVVMSVRHVELPDVAGAHVWFRPITVGLRLQ